MDNKLLLVLFAGAALAFLVNQFTDALMGDLVAVGVLAALRPAPAVYAAVLAITLIDYVAVRLLEKGVLLYGRRRIGAHMLLSVALSAAAAALPALSVYKGAAGLALALVPGFLANDCYDQGVLKTLGFCALGTAALLLI